MLIHLHKQATTTPKVRAAIQSSDDAGTVVAERFGVTPQTIYKWRKRGSVEDRSHTPHRLQTTLTPAQEAVAVALRKTLLVSLDDLLAVVREFLNPHVSRSGLDRCLRRHGVGNLRDLQARAARPKHSGFKAYEPGYIHVDVKYLPHPLGPLLRNALPGNEWLMKPRGVTSSSPSTRCPAGDALHHREGGDEMGLHPRLQGKDRGQRAAVPARPGACLPDPHPHHFDRQRQGVH
jgi:transposase-like protein